MPRKPRGAKAAVKKVGIWLNEKECAIFEEALEVSRVSDSKIMLSDILRPICLNGLKRVIRKAKHAKG